MTNDECRIVEVASLFTGLIGIGDYLIIGFLRLEKN